MKKCYTCQQEKPLIEFNKSKRRKDGLNTICKDCPRIRSRNYYQNNTELHKKNVYRTKCLYIEQLRYWINTEIRKNGCSLCKETHPCCLEFHHINQDEKEELVSRLISENNRRKLEIELNKCAIVCSNCHRKIHAGLLQNPVDKQLKNIKVPPSSKKIEYISTHPNFTF